MARIENDREDLLSEATALVERVELVLLDDQQPAETVVVGFRKDGSASIYFGAEPVYQFNTANKLRRAFWRGELYKADRCVLIAMHRERHPTEVVLRRRDLTAEEYGRFREIMESNLLRLAQYFDAGSYRVVGQVPQQADVVGRAQRILPELIDAPLASSPHVLGA